MTDEMKITIMVVVAVLIIAREFIAFLFGWGRGEEHTSLLENRKHNAAIDREWKKNGCHIEEVTVGWRKDEGQKERVNSHGVTEYYRRIR